MVDNEFINAYWLFRTRKIRSLRELGKVLGHGNYYHKSIYIKAKKYESSNEYKVALKQYSKLHKNLRGEISTKEYLCEETKGRIGEKGITPEFVKVYWEYENYYISPSEAYQKTGYSKNWFHNIALKYENSSEFYKDIKKQKNIKIKPARTRTVPEGFREDSEIMSIEELAKKYEINKIQIERLILKLDKSNVFKAIKDNKR